MGVIILLITIIAYVFVASIAIQLITTFLLLFGYEHLYKPQFLMVMMQKMFIPIDEFTLSCAWAAIIFLVFIVLYQLPPIQQLFLSFQNISKPKGPEGRLLTAYWNEVCSRADVDPNKYRLYIQYKDELNAFALGHNRVVVMIKSLAEFDPDEMKALLAHELGHIIHRDTTYSMTQYAISTAYAWIFHIFNLGIFLLTFIYNILRFIPIINWIAFLFILITLFIQVFVYILNFILDFFLLLLIPFGSRRQEYRADRYAYELGYGKPMLSVLEKFRRYGDTYGLKSQLISSHPPHYKRIHKIEELIEKSAPLLIKNSMSAKSPKY